MGPARRAHPRVPHPGRPEPLPVVGGPGAATRAAPRDRLLTRQRPRAMATGSCVDRASVKHSERSSAPPPAAARARPVNVDPHPRRLHGPAAGAARLRRNGGDQRTRRRCGRGGDRARAGTWRAGRSSGRRLRSGVVHSDRTSSPFNAAPGRGSRRCARTALIQGVGHDVQPTGCSGNSDAGPWTQARLIQRATAHAAPYSRASHARRRPGLACSYG